MRRRMKGLLREQTRHGKFVWYYRDGHNARTRIHGEYGTPEFNAAVMAASHGTAVNGASAKLSHTDPSSFGWLVDQFIKSPAHLQKEVATQKARRNVLKRIVEKGAGAQAYRDLTDVDIRALRDQIAATGAVAMANGAVAILRVMFNWAVEDAKLLRTNPCLGVKAIKYQSGTNYVWTNEDMLRFEEVFPLGTRERLAYALLLYSGQRSGDVVGLGRQHIRNGWLNIKAHKTGKPAQVPILPALAEAIEAGPTGDLTFLVGEDGASLTVSHFGRWFRAACDKAGVPECTPHGLRHAGATRLAERGADVATLQGIYGWSLGMAQRYTRTADMRRSVEKDIHLLNHAA